MTSAATDDTAPSQWPFLGLLLALSVPFWLLAEVNRTQLLPGLPLSGLMAFVPAAAAAVLAGRAGGWRAAGRLFARAFDAGRMRGRTGWLALVMLMPVLALIPWFVSHAPGAAGAPAWVPFAMLGGFFVAAAGEELGWSAWLTEPLTRRHGELAAALVIGGLWAAWHLIPFLQAGRGLEWIAWQCAKTVAVRLVMVRLYFGTGRSVFAVILFHAVDNVAAFLLPFYGGAYDPRFTALAVGLAALVLTLLRPRQ